MTNHFMVWTLWFMIIRARHACIHVCVHSRSLRAQETFPPICNSTEQETRLLHVHQCPWDSHLRPGSGTTSLNLQPDVPVGGDGMDWRKPAFKIPVMSQNQGHSIHMLTYVHQPQKVLLLANQSCFTWDFWDMWGKLGEGARDSPTRLQPGNLYS